MTENAINTRSKALELLELSSKELDAVSGGDKSHDTAKSDAVKNSQIQQENFHQASAMKMFQEMLMHMD